MRAASSPAFVALPIATVATGTPRGICTIECSESTPDSADVFTGTPTTGSGVIAATMPGRCAAPPAPATITFKPLRLALRAYSTSRSGVRCALTIVHSYSILNFSSISQAAFMTGRSLSLPMITPTSGAMVDFAVFYQRRWRNNRAVCAAGLASARATTLASVV